MTTNLTGRLHQAIQDKYQPPEYLVAFEVQVPGRGDNLQFADAVAMDTRKGAGYVVTGMELKVSRGDFLRERADPGKAEAARAYCDYWWIVEGSPGVVLNHHELPPGVGLLSLNEDDVLVVRHQAVHIHGVKDRAIDRAFLAAFLRRLDPIKPRAYWEGKVRAAESRGYTKGLSQGRRLSRKLVREGAVSSEEWPTP